jgi:hypothetical protein
VTALLAIFIAKLLDVFSLLAIAMGAANTSWWKALFVALYASMASLLWVAYMNGRPLLPAYSYAAGIAAFMLVYFISARIRKAVSSR